MHQFFLVLKLLSIIVILDKFRFTNEFDIEFQEAFEIAGKDIQNDDFSTAVTDEYIYKTTLFQYDFNNVDTLPNNHFIYTGLSYLKFRKTRVYKPETTINENKTLTDYTSISIIEMLKNILEFLTVMKFN